LNLCKKRLDGDTITDTPPKMVSNVLVVFEFTSHSRDLVEIRWQSASSSPIIKMLGKCDGLPPFNMEVGNIEGFVKGSF
jgi:hypothetical protein